MRKYLLMILSVVLFSCSQQTDPQQIVNKATLAHGTDAYENVLIKFDFREAEFSIQRSGGKFEYKKVYIDSSGNQIAEMINNEGIHKYINSTKAEIDEKEKLRIDNQVNSVIYFTMLPQPLNDKAVIKKYLGDTKINDNEYHKIEVTFKEEGGGKDYQDRFIYWFNKETNELDYFAYYYFTNGGGHRFRELINKRNVGGILFADHINYTTKEIDSNIEDYDKYYRNEKLEKVSDVILRNIEVKKVGN